MYYTKRPTKKQYKEVLDLINSFDVKAKYIKKGWSDYDIEKELIRLDLRECETYQKLLSTAFHELGHTYCIEFGLYKIYHHDLYSGKKMYDYVRRNGLKIERFVDKIGKELMESYYPEIPYVAAYDTEEGVKFFKQWMEKEYGNKN